jgi:hypothetical protein
VGSASSGLGGSHVITMWANGSNMQKSDLFHLVIGFYVYSSSYASMANLVRMWPGIAGAAVDMKFFGNGAVLDSVAIG